MRRTLAFVAPPFAGHLNPILGLARTATQAGYNVTIVTGSSKQAVVAAAGFRCIAPPCLGAGVLEGIADTSMAVGGNPARLLMQLRSSLGIAVAAHKELSEIWRRERPDAVIADSIAVSAGLVAQELGVPWVTTIATPLAIECRQGTPSYLGGWTQGDGIWPQLRDFAGRALIRGVKRGLAFAVRRQLAQLGTPLYRSDGSEACYSPVAILGFGIRELEFWRDWPAVFRMIGPVFDNPEPAAVPELPSGRKRILVTLGTHLPWAKATLCRDIAWLANCRKDLSFVGSLGSFASKPIPRQVAENAVVHDFIPYAGALEKFDAIIHHGGAGITYACIKVGRPCIVVPHDYDQFDYAARIAAKGAGLRVDKLCGGAMLNALDQVLVPENFPNLATLSTASQRYAPGQEFLEVLEQVIEERHEAWSNEC